MRPAWVLAVALTLGGCTGSAPAAPAPAPVVSVPSTVAPTTTSTTATFLEATRIQVRPSRSLQRPRPPLDEQTRARVLAAIYSYTDWDADRMIRVAMCESGLNPWAVNGRHHGILQIANSTLGLIEEHVALAHSMWLKRGYSPWACKG